MNAAFGHLEALQCGIPLIVIAEGDEASRPAQIGRDRVRFLAMDARPPSARIVAIIPIGELEGAKSRLGDTLDAEERRDLVTEMLDRTVRAALATPEIAETLVVSPDREVLAQAAALGARTLLQRSQ